MGRIIMKKRLVILIAITALLASMFSISAYANELQITKKYVDSNTWTNVGSAVKTSTSTYSYATVKITALYKADGSSSGYQQLKVKVTLDGTSKVLTKGTNYDITLPSSHIYAGASISYYCMGNDPALDCQASGYFDSH
jgi:hypothetical protein